MASREHLRLTGNPSTSTQPILGGSAQKGGPGASEKALLNNQNVPESEHVGEPSSLTNKQLPGK